ncbi:MAG: biotin-dependent carboxyltransferase family protein [Clostridia bacterium]|nr:biotin-dependent carboxyltransferase family protein [Clostridia bacterium]
MDVETFRIIEPGIYSSIQDGGRRGFRKYGMPVSGAMDPYAFNILNNLLGNRPVAPAIEITGSWFSGEFLRDCSFALSGANPGADLDGLPIVMNRVFEAQKGNVINFSRMHGGIRTYLGVSGGFVKQVFLGSMSMCRGERIKRGEILFSENLKTEPNETDFDFSYIRADGNYTIRVRKGPDSDFFDERILRNFLNDGFFVSRYLDRMGVRLDASENISGGPDGIVTKPVFPGCIQLTGAGMPIIIMNDGQTTGGYPVIAVVEREDLRIAGQLKAGDTLAFKSV